MLLYVSLPAQKESERFKQLLLGEDKFKDAMHFFRKRGHLDEAEE